jgi:hypothetical protein
MVTLHGARHHNTGETKMTTFNDKLIEKIETALEGTNLVAFVDANGDFELGGTGCQPSNTKTVSLECLEDYTSLDYDLDEWFKSMWPEDMVGSSTISQDCYRGTRKQWASYLRDTDWYSEYVSKLEDDESPMSEDEWIEATLDEELQDWDGDMDYERLDY